MSFASWDWVWWLTVPRVWARPLIDKGQTAANIRFQPRARDEIVRQADGSLLIAQMLC